ILFIVSVDLFRSTPRPPQSTRFPYPTLFRSPRLEIETFYQRLLALLKTSAVGRGKMLRGGVVGPRPAWTDNPTAQHFAAVQWQRSEEHTSELQSPYDLVCRLLLVKKKASQMT